MRNECLTAPCESNSMSDLIFSPAAAMAQQIRKKQISPVELVEAHFAQIEKLNPKLNAFVQLDAERALPSPPAKRSTP